MSPAEITIRQATLADKAAISDFLGLAYPDRAHYKFPARWEWEFERNPYWPAAGLPIWIAVDAASGKIVGQSCALVEPLLVNGREHRIAWGVDFHVLPDYRGQGIGSQLQAANNRSHPIFMSLSMAGSAARIKSRLGLKPLPPVPVYEKIINHAPASVQNTLQDRFPGIPQWMAGWIAPSIATLLSARDRRRDRKRLRPVATAPEKVSRFGPESDALWASISGRYRALVRRDADFLNWKFAEQPHMKHESFMAWRGNKPCGHLILRRARPPERNTGVLVDLFCDPDDQETIHILVAQAVTHFRQQRVETIAAASSVPSIQRAFLSAGFKPTKQVTPRVRANLSLPENGWLLGKGDHDWDQYPLA